MARTTKNKSIVLVHKQLARQIREASKTIRLPLLSALLSLRNNEGNLVQLIEPLADCHCMKQGPITLYMRKEADHYFVIHYTYEQSS